MSFIKSLRAFNPDKESGEPLRWLVFNEPTSGGDISLSTELDVNKEYALIKHFDYSLPTDFNGIDRFSLVVDEGDRQTEISFEINVKSVPDPPQFLIETPVVLSAFREKYFEFTFQVNEPDRQSVDFKVLDSSQHLKWLSIVSKVNYGNDISVTLGGIVPSNFETHSISLVATDPTGRFSILPVELSAK